MAKHKPNVIWQTRMDHSRPYQAVSTAGEKTIQIALFPGNKGDGLGFKLSRRDARLLAKRINQCLDGTK